MTSSFKSTFIKMVPRRFIPDDKFVSIGSNQYTTTFVPKEPEAVYRSNGTTSPVSLAFSWDNSTGTLTVTTTSAPNENIFADYPLYFCTSVTEYVSDDPVADTGGIKEWNPRLKNNPSFNQDVSDLLSGVMATSSSGFSIINDDYELNKYTTKYDVFRNREVRTYVRIGDTFKNLYNGLITKLTHGKSMKVTIKSKNKLFDYDANLNNTDKYTYYTQSQWPPLQSSFESKPIPVQYNLINYKPEAIFKEQNPNQAGESDVALSALFEPSQLVELAKIGTDTWTTGISDLPWSRTSLETIPCTHITSFTKPFYQFGKDRHYTVVSVSSDYIGYFFIGLRLTGYDNVAATWQKDVHDINYDTNRVTFYDGIVAPTIKTSIHIPSAYLFYRASQYPELLMCLGAGVSQPEQFTWSYDATSGGQYLVKIKVNAYGIDPSDITLYGVALSKSRTQTSYIQKYIESTGQQIDSASFSQAQTDANTKIYTIVNKDELQTVSDVVENAAQSNNGIIWYDHITDKYKYRIVKSSMSGIEWQVDDTDILEPDILPMVDNTDTYNRITMRNDITPEGDYIRQISKSSSKSVGVSLYSESRSQTFPHNLFDVSPVIANKLDQYSGAMVFYEFSLKSDLYFDINIGEIIRINNINNRLLSAGDVVDLLVVGVRKSAETIKVKGYDFKKIP